MKCPNCNGVLGLEDEVCPYCGTPNAMAAQHQADMAHYREEYQRTQNDVIAKTSAMQSHGSWLVILVVLLVAFVVGIVLNVNAWDIGYMIRESNVEANTEQNNAAMDAYLEQGDYGQFLGYYDAYDVYLGNNYAYSGVHSAAAAYVDLLSYVSDIHNERSHSFSDNRISDTCTYLAHDLNRIFTVEQDYSYDLDRYLPADKKVYVDDIRERARVIAQAYFGLSDEDIREIPNMSESKLAKLIEEGIAE